MLFNHQRTVHISLHVNWLVVRGHGCLLHSFRQRGVTVADPCDVLGRATVLHGKRALHDELSGSVAHDVRSKNLIRALLSDELHHTGGVAVGACTRVGHHGERSLGVFDALLLALLLRQAYPRHLGVRVQDARHVGVVHVSVLTSHRFHARHAILLSLVSKHGSGNAVANGVNAGDVRLEVVVHLNHPAVHLDAKRLEAKSLREWAAPDGYEHVVALKRLRISARRGLHRQLDGVSVALGSRHLRLVLELESFLLELSLHRLADFAVHAGNHVRQELDDGDLRAEARPDARHLQPDDAASDADKVLRNLLERDGARAADNALLVNGHAGKRRHLAAGGDENVLRLNRLLATLAERHLHLTSLGNAAPALRVRHLVLLEESLNTRREPRDGVILGLHHALDADADVADGDSVLVEVVLSVVVVVAGVEQRLGRDAPDVQARSSERASSFDARHLHSELSRLDGCDVPSRPSPDHDEVLHLPRRR
mmetsp:Transcript_6430/g.14612  ORF Transcript_6430/g.14612 Transcript_6430/m.14612 type:complete len:483 (+) Transcript_6430:49-1497(+)